MAHDTRCPTATPRIATTGPEPVQLLPPGSNVYLRPTIVTDEDSGPFEWSEDGFDKSIFPAPAGPVGVEVYSGHAGFVRGLWIRRTSEKNVVAQVVAFLY